MDFKGQHILSSKQFDKQSLIELFEETEKMWEIFNSGRFSDLMAGKIMATLFFEPSTRTRFSFETAMLKLGGSVLSNPDMVGTSSIQKLESLYDTGKTVSQMADIIVMRHPTGGSIADLAKGSNVPVINAGEGAKEHPTQGLLDVYTIMKEFGNFDGLTIGMVGDLKNSRVQHSQCDLLRYFNCKFVFLALEGLEMPSEIVDDLKAHRRNVEIVRDIKEFASKVDVISVSRVQKERFASMEEYKKYAGLLVVDKEVMDYAKPNAIVIQPLPRVDEVAISVDNDPRAKYFQQIKNGVVVRMALIKKVLLG